MEVGRKGNIRHRGINTVTQIWYVVSIYAWPDIIVKWHQHRISTSPSLTTVRQSHRRIPSSEEFGDSTPDPHVWGHDVHSSAPPKRRTVSPARGGRPATHPSHLSSCYTWGPAPAQLPSPSFVLPASPGTCLGIPADAGLFRSLTEMHRLFLLTVASLGTARGAHPPEADARGREADGDDTHAMRLRRDPGNLRPSTASGLPETDFRLALPSPIQTLQYSQTGGSRGIITASQRTDLPRIKPALPICDGPSRERWQQINRLPLGL